MQFASILALISPYLQIKTLTLIVVVYVLCSLPTAIQAKESVGLLFGTPQYQSNSQNQSNSQSNQLSLPLLLSGTSSIEKAHLVMKYSGNVHYISGVGPLLVSDINPLSLVFDRLSTLNSAPDSSVAHLNFLITAEGPITFAITANSSSLTYAEQIISVLPQTITLSNAFPSPTPTINSSPHPSANFPSNKFLLLIGSALGVIGLLMLISRLLSNKLS